MAHFSLPTSYNIVSEDFVIILFVIICVWFVQYHYNRRKFYKFAWQMGGPFSWPFIGNALWFSGSTEDIYRNIMKIATTYSTCRTWLGNRLFVMIMEPKDLEIILNNSRSMEKEYLYKYAEVIVGKGLFTAPVEQWKRHRKIIMPTFNQKILDTFVDVFVEQTNILAENLEKYLNKDYSDIFQPISLCTLDIICETAMGIKVNAQTQDCQYVKSANTAMGIIFGRMFKMWYHFDFIFNRLPISKVLMENAKGLRAFTSAVIKQKRIEVRERLRKEKEEDKIDDDDIKIPKRKAFLELLLELSEQGTRFTDEELREEVDTLMIAGSDTTASINSFVCMMLGAHPDIQEKVYEEIVEVLGETNGTFTIECLPKLQYLERVIKETMRLFPVGPAIVRAITNDLKLETCTVPGGVSAVLVIMHTHRNPNIWPNPLKFDPDRFLPEEVAKRHPYSYLPFSGGPRNCIGTRYAMMAMKALISIILKKYKIKAKHTIQDIKLKADLMLKPVEGHLVKLELRNPENI